MRPISARPRVAALAALMAGTALVHVPALAQAAGPVATSIVADTTAATGLDTVATANGADVTISGGTVSGANLFHSFAQFDLASGGTASWSAPGAGSIANIVNRVTGAGASHISGTIDTSAMPGADFYFINPNGVLFGAGAELNVPGAAYFSTASQLAFDNGDIFAAHTANGSVLSMAAPSSFGFVGGEAGIVMENVGRDPQAWIESGDPQIGRLVLVAPDIVLENTGLLVSGFDFLAIGGAGTVDPAAPFDGALGGSVRIENSQVYVRADAAGTGVARISGGSVTLDNAALTTRGRGNFTSADILIGGNTVFLSNTDLNSANSGNALGGTLAIAAANAITVDNSRLVSDAVSGGAGGDIVLASTGNVEIADSIVRSMSSGSNADASAGSIDISAGGMLAVRDTVMRSFTEGLSAGGSLRLASVGGMMLEGGVLQTSTFATGEGGVIGGIGGDITVSSSASLSIDGTEMAAYTYGLGDSGRIFVNAGGDIAANGARISSNSQADTVGGDAGAVFLSAVGDVDLADTTLLSITRSTGEAGEIFVGAGGTLAIDGARISTRSNNVAEGGPAGTVLLDGEEGVGITASEVFADTSGPGEGGNVIVRSDGDVALTDSVLTSNTYSSGEGGFVSIEAGGDVTLSGSETRADSGGIPDNAQDGYVEQTSGLGNGGAVLLDAGGAIQISDSTVSTNTRHDGDGGFVGITAAGELALSGGAQVIATTEGSGKGGGLSIDVGSFTATDASLSTKTTGEGDSVGILLGADTILIGPGAEVSSASEGAGAAGLVFVGGAVDGETAARSLVIDGGSISARGDGTGQAGNVRARADTFHLLNGGEIVTNSANAFPAGFIELQALDLRLDGIGDDGVRTRISSVNVLRDAAPGGTNTGGDISILSKDLAVTNGAVVNTSSRSSDAGIIFIDLGRDGGGVLTLLGEGENLGAIRTDSFVAGSGGLIGIFNARALVADGSEISASGDVSNAFVTIDRQTVRINSSDNTNIVNVTGVAAVSPEQDVSSSTAVVSVPFIDASKVLEGRCEAARAQGDTSKLDVQSPGPYPIAARGGGDRELAAAGQDGAARGGCL